MVWPTPVYKRIICSYCNSSKLYNHTNIYVALCMWNFIWEFNMFLLESPNLSACVSYSVTFDNTLWSQQAILFAILHGYQLHAHGFVWLFVSKLWTKLTSFHCLSLHDGCRTLVLVGVCDFFNTRWYLVCYYCRQFCWLQHGVRIVMRTGKSHYLLLLQLTIWSLSPTTRPA